MVFYITGLWVCNLYMPLIFFFIAPLGYKQGQMLIKDVYIYIYLVIHTICV